MRYKTGLDFLVLGPPWLKAKVAQAVGGPATHSSIELKSSSTIAVVHADYGGRGKGPNQLRSLLQAGVMAGVGVAPATSHQLHLELYAAGAAEVLLVSSPALEWAHRLQHVARSADLERRSNLSGLRPDPLSR